MGSGSWTSQSFTNYSKSVGRDVDLDTGVLRCNYSAQDMFVQRHLAPELNPHNIMRECCDSEEHPNTIPVILALDVTGSMGSAATDVAKKLNYVMTELYKQVKDVQFMIIGIGDLAYDNAPAQVSQFESDIRIAEQLDKIYFEAGGGSNPYESYTLAWYIGSRHCKLDCWNRNKKGIIITMGDEIINPYLPKDPLSGITGDNLQADVDTKDLYIEARQKYNIYHLDVQHGWRNRELNVSSFSEVLGEDHVFSVNVNSIADKIVEIVVKEYKSIDEFSGHNTNNSEGISW